MAANKQKNSKQGRQKKSGQNARYINENRHAKSHIKRITKHLSRYGENDKKAVAVLASHKAAAGFMSTRPK